MIEQKLLRLERMSSAEKIRYWGEGTPWIVDGASLRLPKVRAHSPSAFELDDCGNIVRAPFLIGRPCFGQVSAFLRHGGGQYVWSPRQNSWQPNRCSRCAVSNACAFVAEERLRSTPKVASLYREWRSLGGRDQTWPKKGSPGTAAVRLRELLGELQKMTFTSVQDQEVRRHYAQVIETKLCNDRERKRRERERRTIEKVRAGEITLAVEGVLDGQRMWRAVEHKKACGHPDAPKSLRHLPPDASMFDAYVWVAYIRVWLRGDAPNPYSCASELHRMGREQVRCVNALRDRVRRSIDRMHLLQRLRVGDRNSTVWPPFTLTDLKEGLRYQPPTE